MYVEERGGGALEKKEGIVAGLHLPPREGRKGGERKVRGEGGRKKRGADHIRCFSTWRPEPTEHRNKEGRKKNPLRGRKKVEVCASDAHSPLFPDFINNAIRSEFEEGIHRKREKRGGGDGEEQGTYLDIDISY